MSKLNGDSKSPSNIVDINTNPSFLHLIQINDSAFPTGAYAHSFGMETYIQENVIRNDKDLKEFCDMYLRQNLASTDAIFVKEAYNLAKNDDKEGLIHLEKLCNGIKLAPETREGSAMMGRQFLQTIYPLHDDHALLTYWYQKFKRKEIRGHHSVAYGIYCAIIGADLQKSIEAFLYSSVTALVQNAIRSVPLGQQSGVRTVYQLLPVMKETTKSVMNKDLDDLDNNTVALEMASMKHEYLFSRLFIS